MLCKTSALNWHSHAARPGAPPIPGRGDEPIGRRGLNAASRGPRGIPIFEDARRVHDRRRPSNAPRETREEGAGRGGDSSLAINGIEKKRILMRPLPWDLLPEQRRLSSGFGAGNCGRRHVDGVGECHRGPTAATGQLFMPQARLQGNGESRRWMLIL
jgi:hypothetical protein